MQRTLTVALVAAFSVCAPVVYADPINLSFETGDFSGWTADIDIGTYALFGNPREGLIARPGGTATIINTSPQSPPLINLGATTVSKSGLQAEPFDGGIYALMLATENPCCFLTPAGEHLLIAETQDFVLEAGDAISGWAAFGNFDFESQDTATVRILNSDGIALATPWVEQSGSSKTGQVNSVPYTTVTPWTHWSWSAPVSGVYTLQLGIDTLGDNRFASVGFFDCIELTTTEPVQAAEPSTGVLLLCGLAGFARWHQSRAGRQPASSSSGTPANRA